MDLDKIFNVWYNLIDLLKILMSCKDFLILVEENQRIVAEGVFMYPVPGKCPVCGEMMEIRRLHCRHCDTAVEGHFSLGRFYHLTPEQLQFAETFIRCEGKITRVEEDMGLSYPTVRARLHALIRALGYEVGPEPAGVSPEERRRILEDLAQGKISSEDAVDLLQG